MFSKSGRQLYNFINWKINTTTSSLECSLNLFYGINMFISLECSLILFYGINMFILRINHFHVLFQDKNHLISYWVFSSVLSKNGRRVSMAHIFFFWNVASFTRPPFCFSVFTTRIAVYVHDIRKHKLAYFYGFEWIEDHSSRACHHFSFVTNTMWAGDWSIECIRRRRTLLSIPVKVKTLTSFFVGSHLLARGLTVRRHLAGKFGDTNLQVCLC